MAETLQALVDKAEIADVVHTYALNIRNRSPELNAGLFTENGSFEVRDADPMAPSSLTTRSRADGLEEVMKSVSSSSASGRVFPAIHNLLVTLNGETASATSLMIATFFPGGRELLGEYEDHLFREDGVWKFTSRCYTIYREG